MISRQQLWQQPIVPSNVISSVGAISVGNSALFLYAPREIIPHYKRPLTYNFNVEMTEAIAEHIINKPSVANSVKKVLNTTPNMSSAIIPASSGGIPIATEAYSEHWMFVLIVDEDSKRNMMGLSNKLLSRTVLIGICAQEPIANHGMMSATPESHMNPNCQLIVTKRLEMTKYNTVNHHGYRNDTKTIVDDGICQYDQGLWGIGSYNPHREQEKSMFFTLMPGDVAPATTVDNNGAESMISFGDSINAKGPTKIDSVLESPRNHLKTILQTFETGTQNIRYQGMTAFGDGIQTMETPAANISNFVHGALAEQKLSSDYNLGSQNMNDVTKNLLTIGMVMSMYRPKVVPINSPKQSRMETIPQHYASRSNVFSSLVCDVLPTYLNQLGLSDIIFMYNSHHDAFQLQHIASALNITQQELGFKWDALQFVLKNELFPILHGNGGAFDLQVSGSISSTVDVILNFLDYELLPVGHMYQENSVLGGIVSPLIGNTDHLKWNSMQLNNLIREVEISASPNIGYY